MDGNKTKVAVWNSLVTNGVVEKSIRSIARLEETLPTNVRRIRRGRFFLSDYEQRTYGSLRKPIFEHYCHGVVVGETEPDEELGGLWCFAAHNDFDLIPENVDPKDWPVYIRTPTGWERKDGARRIKAPSDETLAKLMEWNLKQLRLK